MCIFFVTTSRRLHIQLLNLLQLLRKTFKSTFFVGSYRSSRNLWFYVGCHFNTFAPKVRIKFLRIFLVQKYLSVELLLLLPVSPPILIQQNLPTAVRSGLLAFRLQLCNVRLYCFKNGPFPASFLLYFSSFQYC